MGYDKSWNIMRRTGAFAQAFGGLKHSLAHQLNQPNAGFAGKLPNADGGCGRRRMEWTVQVTGCVHPERPSTFVSNLPVCRCASTAGVTNAARATNALGVIDPVDLADAAK